MKTLFNSSYYRHNQHVLHLDDFLWIEVVNYCTKICFPNLFFITLQLFIEGEGSFFSSILPEAAEPLRS
jgi:hypothetical protein